MSYTDAIDDVIALPRRTAQAQAIGAIDDNPENAARALRLSQTTGVPAPVIYGDLDNFERQNKTALAGDIVNNNAFISDYLARNPMASKVSNDDYGQLDTVSQSVFKLSQRTSSTGAFLRAAERGAIPAIGSMPAMAAGATIGAGAGAFGGPFAPVTVPVGAVVGGLLGGFGAGYAISIAQEWLLSHVPEAQLKLFGLDKEQQAIDKALHPTAQFMGGMAPFLAGMKPTAASLRVRTIGAGFGAGLEAGTELAFEGHVDPKNVALSAAAGFGFATPNKAGQYLFDLGHKITPWIKAGQHPPAGIDPLIDAVKAEQNVVDLKDLNEALKDVQLSATRERSPELFGEFLRQHTDEKIGISVDAVLELYGDKVPHPEDGILGWIPGIERQLELAWATGGDIMVPVADWLARVDPSVAKALEDGTRVREGNLTKLDAEAAKEAAAFDVFHGSPHEFDAFSMEKIGTGEGAQRYGHGLYFAENPAVGKDYASRAADTLVDGVHYNPDYPVHQAATMVFDLGTREAAIEKIKQDIARAPDEEFYQEVLQRLENPKELPPVKQLSSNLYKVSIKADKAKFLDWDKPLGEQSPYVQERLKVLDIEHGPFDQKAPLSAAYSMMADRLGGVRKGGDAAASKALREAGIPGIKYLDQGSRPGPGGMNSAGMKLDTPPKTHNIVLFDESLAEITHKNDQPVPRPPKDPVEAVREAAGLARPLRAERKLTLQRNSNTEKVYDWQTTAGANDHSFDLIGPDGKPIASIALTEQDGGKNLYVNEFEGVEGNVTNKLGTRVMLDVLRQVKMEFPLAESISGFRADGARWFGGKNPGDAAKVTISLKNIEATVPDAAPAKPPKQPITIGESQPFQTAAAGGMTEAVYKRIAKLTNQQQIDDVDYFTARALKEQKRRETAEWKAEEARIRPDVVAEINARPAIAADTLLRDGTYFGEDMKTRARIASDSVPPEVREALPFYYFEKNGLHPDDLAALTGFENGSQLLLSLMDLQKEIRDSGKRPGDWKRELIKGEIDRRMAETHGDLQNNILDAAVDQVLGETTLDILHEETLALALEAGAQFTIQKGEIKSWVHDRLMGTALALVSSKRSLAAAGRAGKALEMGYLKDNPAEALRQKVRQYVAVVEAQEARKIEKAEAQFEKTAKRFSNREVKGVDQEYTDFIQAMLIDAGLPVKRSVQELKEANAAYGSLEKFVEAKYEAGWEVDAASPTKPLSQMTVAEFDEFKAGIDSLAHVGRAEKLITIAGEKMEFADFKEEVIANIKSLPLRKETINKAGKLLYGLDAGNVKMEQIAKDLDLRQELGPLWNAIIRPMAEAEAKQNVLLTRLAKRLAEIKEITPEWKKSLDDTIPQEFFFDPRTGDGAPFDLTRQNMINIMLNFGNYSNIDKATRGWFGKEAKAGEAKLWQLFDQHATKEDWEFVQRIWNVFEEFRKESEVMYKDLSGLAPRWIENVPISNKHGEFEGGYFPIINDPWRSNQAVSVEQKSQGNFFGPNYYRATIGNGYTKARTGVVDYVDFQSPIGELSGKLQQMIHDIAFRPAVMEARKVVYDKDIRSAIRNHYGPEYEAQFDPWLKAVAGQFDQPEAAIKWYNAVLRRARLNLVAHALPMNLRVILSPSLGEANPAAAGRFYAQHSDNVALAHAKSQEIPHTFMNMDRDFREKVEQLVRDKGMSGLQADAVRLTFMPMVHVEQQFRMITFVDEYKQGLARGLSETDAAAVADSSVRERHGSSAVFNLPAIMRGSEAMKMATTFMGFFNTMYQGSRQLPGNLRRGEYGEFMKNYWTFIAVPALFGAILFNQESKENREAPFFKRWANNVGKALALQPLQTVPFIREAANYVFEGFTPRTPIESILTAAGTIWSEGKRVYQGKEMQKPIQAGANIIGLGLGVPTMAQVGRTGQYVYDVNKGRIRPKNILEWSSGIINGPPPKR